MLLWRVKYSDGLCVVWGDGIPVPSDVSESSIFVDDGICLRSEYMGIYDARTTEGFALVQTDGPSAQLFLFKNEFDHFQAR
ncbi:hypothetical protein RRF57_010706 [Xylaria bambusicola]|uniref:Uncharacterized protein n=1 Tax=Xylaria bambusicola TaxID=326684 RepID=A0AAN7ULN0_9PEZI